MTNRLPALSRALLPFALLLLIVAAPGVAEDFTVQVVDNAFQPRNLEISVGDTVTWTNSGSMPHNVNTTSGPEDFRCANGCDDTGGDGDVASNAWSFTRTFDNEGTVEYICDFHVGVGMRGTIVVQATGGGGGGGGGGGDEAGSVAFRRASSQTTESAGSFSLGVERAVGDDGAVSVRVRSNGGTATPDNDYTPVDQVLSWADGEDGVKSFDLTLLDDDQVESTETVVLGLSDPTGGVTIAQPSQTTLEIADDDTDVPPCEAGPTTLCLGAGGRFQVQVEWQAFDGSTGSGMTVDLPLEDTGLFYFFEPDNVEMNVKVLNACGNEQLGNKFWVLFAASTNVAYTVTVTDTEGDVSKTYENPLGNLAQATIDVEAFDTCP